MLQLSGKWVPRLISQPETGMGFQVASITVDDGTCYDDVMIVGGCITSIRGSADIPFEEGRITDIRVTHSRRDRSAER